jgi:hypothetical protein
MYKDAHKQPYVSVAPYADADTTQPGPTQKVQYLASEIHSIHAIWSMARIGIVGHSHGGEIAQLYWQCAVGRLGNLGKPFKCPSIEKQDFAAVRGIFSLDAPINGIRNTFASQAKSEYGPDFLKQWESDWNRRGRLGVKMFKLDTGLYTAVGTADDPDYTCGIGQDCGDFPDDGIQSQVFLFCAKPGKGSGGVDDVCSPLKTKGNYLSPCPAGTQIGGVSGHEIAQVCQPVIDRIVAKLTRGK